MSSIEERLAALEAELPVIRQEVAEARALAEIKAGPGTARRSRPSSYNLPKGGREEVRPLEDRLTTLSELEQGWLDGEGERITSETLDTARWLVPLLKEKHGTSIYVYPTVDGGLSLEWRGTNGVTSTLEIMAS